EHPAAKTLDSAGFSRALAAAAPAAPAKREVAESPARVGETQLVVEVQGALYVLPISGIEEIMPMREVTPLPQSAAAVRGVLFLRGHAVTIVDLAVLLGGKPPQGRRIVVLLLDGERYGLVVDQVHKVVAPGELSDLSTPLSVLGGSTAIRAVARLGEEVVSMLDLERLIPAATQESGP
ncbi:MAG: chemotaxis protein CheW, partial [Acidobacteriota bacterium]